MSALIQPKILNKAKAISHRRYSISQIFEALVDAKRQRLHVPVPVARSQDATSSMPNQ